MTVHHAFMWRVGAPYRKRAVRLDIDNVQHADWTANIVLHGAELTPRFSGLVSDAYEVIVELDDGRHARGKAIPIDEDRWETVHAVVGIEPFTK